MKTLNLSFKGSLNQSHVFKLAYANEQLSELVVQKAMDDLAALHLFQKDGAQLYVSPTGANYVTTTTEPIFAK